MFNRKSFLSLNEVRKNKKTNEDNNSDKSDEIKKEEEEMRAPAHPRRANL